LGCGFFVGFRWKSLVNCVRCVLSVFLCSVGGDFVCADFECHYRYFFLFVFGWFGNMVVFFGVGWHTGSFFLGAGQKKGHEGLCGGWVVWVSAWWVLGTLREVGFVFARGGVGHARGGHGGIRRARR